MNAICEINLIAIVLGRVTVLLYEKPAMQCGSMLRAWGEVMTGYTALQCSTHHNAWYKHKQMQLAVLFYCDYKGL